MNRRLWLDSESAGLVGQTKLFQYAVDDGPVQFIPMFKDWEQDEVIRQKLYDLWDLLDDPETLFIGYHTAHDAFHALRTMHRLEGYEYDSPERLIMPFNCKMLDLAVHAAMESPLSPFAYSKGASRTIAAVRKIPRQCAEVVAARVESELKKLLPPVVGLKRHEKKVKGRKELVTICWTLDGRLSLKNLMQVYGLKTIKLAEIWPLPAKGEEALHLPYPQSCHDALELQCDTVMSDESNPFWLYAALDVHFLRVLYEKLGAPTPGHHDTCTHIVAYTRYYGFELDRQTLLDTRAAYTVKVQEAQDRLAGCNLASPKQRLALLRQHDPLIASSAKKIIQVVADSDRPAAPIAQAMMDYTAYTQRLNQVEKVLECRTGRAHPSIRVMGTRTGREAGEAGLNWHGIPQAKKMEVPGKGKILVGIRAAMYAAAVGDWSQFEVAIAAAAYPDAQIQADLDNKIDAHCMNAVLMHPAIGRLKWDYAEMVKRIADHDPVATSARKAIKAVTFGLQYFCQAAKVAEVLGVSLPTAEKALANYHEMYQGFAAYKHRIEKTTQTADTEKWSRDSVKRMAREVIDMTGYTMRWDFEAKVAEALWQLGGTGINTGVQGTVVRNTEKGRQSFDGAVKSALLGGAISIQAAVSRQRGNAKVQATGANINKALRAALWDTFHIPTLGIHDECVFPAHPNLDIPKVQALIDSFTAEWKKKIPSLFFDFHATKRHSDK